MDVLDLTTAANAQHWIVRSPVPVLVEAEATEGDEPEDSPEAHLSPRLSLVTTTTATTTAITPRPNPSLGPGNLQLGQLDFGTRDWTSNIRLGSGTEANKPCKKPKTQRPIRSATPHLADFVKADDEMTNRLFNTRNSGYFFPSDADEHGRLSIQHAAFTLGFGALYPCPDQVRAVLSPEDGKSKAILDLGCGTGIWAIEMARENPHSNVRGVDLVPCPATDVPSNCSFEIDDINCGLEHFYGQFDLVHARLVQIGIKSYSKMVDEVARCLKPGGLAIFIEGDLDLYDQDRTTILPIATYEGERPSDSHNLTTGLASLSLTEAGRLRRKQWTQTSWLQRMIYEVGHIAQMSGSDIEEAKYVIENGFWDNPLFNSEQCGTGSLFLPLGPWPRHRDLDQSQILQYGGSLMRMDVIGMSSAFQPAFLKFGIPKQTVQQLCNSIDHELTTQRFNAWSRLRIAWGRAPMLPTQPTVPRNLVPRPQTRVRTRSQTHIEFQTSAQTKMPNARNVPAPAPASATALAPGSAPAPTPDSARAEPLNLNPNQLVYHTTRGQSLDALKKRESTRGWRPPPLVRKMSRSSSPAPAPTLYHELYPRPQKREPVRHD